jgi:hypothetical protein
MSLHTASGSLPNHQYVFVEPNAIGDHDWLMAVWFGLHSYPGRCWGCHVLLECGAVYRNIPIHHLATRKTDTPWTVRDAQRWDCYSRQFSTHVYDYLAPFRVIARLRDNTEHAGKYLFTCIPIGDAFTAVPYQSKEFTFCALDNGRLVALPTNNLLIHDESLSTHVEWPKCIRQQTEIWSCERG